MLSLLRSGARRLRGIRSLDCSSASCQSRAFGTSDLGVYGSNELSQYLHLIEEGGRVDKGTAQHQQPSTAGAIFRRAILDGKWGALSLPLKAAEALEGFNRATAGRLQHWSSPLALPGASALPLPGFWQPVPLPRWPEHSSGCDDDAGEPREDGAGGLSDGGLWATSVRRKRVTKMRKHKWRKRRKLQRQSASRNK
ncbi:unnamed protein product [Scytosiphon promiscuus]